MIVYSVILSERSESKELFPVVEEYGFFDYAAYGRSAQNDIFVTVTKLNNNLSTFSLVTCNPGIFMIKYGKKQGEMGVWVVNLSFVLL